MRNLKYETIVYNNGIYGIKSGIRRSIENKTRECLRRKRRSTKSYSKTELIIKLSLIISILSLAAIIWLG